MSRSRFILTTALASLIASASAICPGFNFGIGQQYDNGGLPSWKVYNDDCTTWEPVTFYTGKNPCDSGIFGCTPDPITFNSYLSGRDGLQYACRPDVQSGQCGDDVISVCCRNDGN